MPDDTICYVRSRGILDLFNSYLNSTLKDLKIKDEHNIPSEILREILGLSYVFNKNHLGLILPEGIETVDLYRNPDNYSKSGLVRQGASHATNILKAREQYKNDLGPHIVKVINPGGGWMPFYDSECKFYCRGFSHALKKNDYQGTLTVVGMIPI